MICNVCGKEFQDGNAFCPFCGSAAAGPRSGIAAHGWQTPYRCGKWRSHTCGQTK